MRRALRSPALWLWGPRALLFAISFYICRELFRTEYTVWLGSIEAAYIAISRYMLDNWRDLTWFPLWYGGIPFQNTYPPLLHGIVALAAALFHISPALAHHAVTAFLFCAGPVAVDALAFQLTRARWYSFWAALAYAVTSISAWLMPSVRADVGALGPRRLQDLVMYGEGPHICALVLIPIALLFLDRAVERRRPVLYVLAALAYAGVALSNWLGTFGLALATIAYLIANTETARFVWPRVVGIVVLAYALACSWIPPSTIAAVRENAKYVGGDYQGVYERLPIYAAALAVLIVVIKVMCVRLRCSPAMQFFTLFALLTSAIALSHDWLGIEIVPQPARYHLEMEMALCLSGAFGARVFFNRTRRRYQFAAALAVVALAIFPLLHERRYARGLIRSTAMNDTIEYQMSKWFDAHARNNRVMAPGSVSFWMNAFTDTPQIAGGFDQGRINPIENIAAYEMYSGAAAGDRAGAIGLTWLKALGAHEVGIGGPHSREQYKPFSHPDEFAGLLPLEWQDGDDRVYGITSRGSLAYAVTRDRIVSTTPVNGIEVGDVEKYTRALDDLTLPVLRFQWTSRHSATIEGALVPADLITLQISYHRGWHAFVSGVSKAVSADGLGQTLIQPGCNGPCRVDLVYDGGAEMQAARILSWTALLGSIIWIVRTRR